MPFAAAVVITVADVVAVVFVIVAIDAAALVASFEKSVVNAR